MRRLLPVGSASLLLTLLAWGCAGSEPPPVEGDGDAATKTDTGTVPTGTATGTTPPPTDGGPPPTDGGGDSGPAQPCVKNDDCKSPSLCTGNNGLACLGGFCVPTNKPMNCDDGIACTNDSCDVNTNACTHKPDDTNCPASSYCDPKVNCIQTLTCTPGDSVCDRLNIDACVGQFSCDAVKKYCVQGDKPCPDRANAATTCTAAGGAPACSWMCNATYVDLNGDLSVVPPAASNGCECKTTDPNDRPTLANVDANCDGIVGNIANAIFVDTLTGNDGNAGTMAAPKKTIQAGISAAGAATPTKDVYVSKGTYPETVTMLAGVSVFGGYDAATAWSRATTNVTAIASNTSVGVLAGGLTKLTELQSVTVSSQNATGQDAQGGGNSSYGILVVNSGAGFTINGCTISAGTGAAGADGPSGGSGAGGSNGGNASDAARGSAGASSCGAPGGQGGNGVSGLTGGQSDSNGTTAAGGGTGANGGSGGTAGTCNTVSASNGGSAPPVGGFGGAGNPGSNGSAGANFGGFDALGTYTPANGGNGVSAGAPGGGGGGGGSGGGTRHGCGFLGTGCCDSTSGGGGGGGGGGCGGQPGSGGRGGGGSFGIVSVASNVQVLQTKMTTRAGGAGGNGGNGGNGGGGGSGGSGGSNTNAGNHPAGNGAAGSSGGSGGRGGGAAGGSGGPSVCIAYKGTSPSSAGTTCTLGGNGTGGTGGTNGVSSAPRGTDGIAQDLKNAP